MRIGYFGGTFDPPHRAHLAAATAAAAEFHLHRVLLAPTGRQPLKTTEPVAPYEDRLAMVRLLCAAANGGGVPLGSPFETTVVPAALEASDVDAPHADSSPNYTVDALETLHAQHPGAELFCIVGADSLFTLRQWKDPERLLQLAQWIVLSRPEFNLNNLAALLLTPEQRARIHLLTGMDDDTSATGLRERLRVGVSPGDRITPEVMLYIARMRLYHPER